MSFVGFGVGDIVVILQLAKALREHFVHAPSQFLQISNEAQSLANILCDNENVLLRQPLTDWQKTALLPILEGCRTILMALSKMVDENRSLAQSGASSVRDKTSRIWKRLAWDPKEIQEYRSRILLNMTLLQTFITSLNSDVALATKESVDRLHERQDNREDREEYREIVDWLTPVDFRLQQTDSLRRRQRGTGEWLLKSREFQDFVTEKNQTLFCPGIPGAGKTIITAAVVDHLQSKFQKDAGVAILFVYCSFRRQHEQSCEQLFASLLKQLLQGRSTVPHNVAGLYKRHKENQTRPSLDEILEALSSVMILHSRIFIVVDALDELQASDGRGQRFVSELFKIQNEIGVNIFATSRFIPEIAKDFENKARLEIRASEDDVQMYLDHNISLLPSFVGKREDLQQLVKTAIVKAVDGMFLLAQLHLNSLVGTRSPKALRDTLIKLPQGSKAYEHAYANCIERIKGQTASAEELAMQALAWVVNAKRALTATELRHALAVELDELEFDEENLPDIDDTVSVCAGLLTFDEESSVVRVVHYTTQQYFEQTQNTWFPHAEAHIARICVTYLSFRVFESGFCRGDEEFEERLRLHPLYEYAAQNWGHHALKSLLQIDVRLSFLQSPTKVEASSQALFAKKRQWIRRYSQFVPRQITGLHLAAYFGLTELSSVLIASGQKIDQENEDGQAAISWAVQRGHTSLVQELLLQGADLRKRDKLGQSLLALAAIAGSEDVIKILLHAGLDGDLKDHNGRTPLSLAAEYGHLEVVKILLTMGKADPDLKNAYGRTPLFWAAKNGHEAIFSILLARGANPDSRDICEETPLWEAANGAHDRIVTLLLANPKVTQESREKYEATRLIREVRMGTEAGVMRLLSKVNPTLRKDAILESLEMASMRGDEAMFKRLLEEGAQYELRDEDTRISLIRAVECENEAIVRSLLERTQGVNVTDESQLGRPLLCLAIQIGNVPIASMLLNGGSDPNRGDGNNDTSLAYAAKYRRREILKLVLDGKDVDINSTNNQGDTPLLLAAKDGFKEILKPLLQAGAAIEAQDYQGRTALVWAATEGHIGALKLLLERGARCDIPDNLQRTPFSYAAENGHEDVVRILLDNNVEADSSCEDGKTPLSYVAANGHESIVQLLLVYCRVNLNSTDNKGWTPLMWAAEEGREAVLTLLTNAGADLNLTNTWGQTPTCRAAQRGHDEIVKFLLERNCLVQTIEDISGWTPLFEAIKEGRESTTELLLACPSVDFEHKDTNGRTPLSWAAESGREKIVEMLLQKENLIIDSRDNMGRTPLLWAARRGREAVTGLLLEANANVNSEDLQGGTPLKLAAQHGHDTVVALLLENGAEINHRNGWTALQCATIEGCVTVEQTLREAGALDSDDFFGIIGLFSDDS